MKIKRSYKGGHDLPEEWINKEKKLIKSLLNKYKNWEGEININYFYASGFLKNPKTNKWIYISFPDERFNHPLANKILIRTAKNNEDYIGGSNCFAENKKEIERLIDRLTK